MPATLGQLTSTRSQFGAGIYALLNAAIRKLDPMEYYFNSVPISISRAAIEPQVFDPTVKGDPRRERKTELARSMLDNDYERALAKLAEMPGLAMPDAGVPWNEIVSRLPPGEAIVLQGGPGTGKTIATRCAAIARLRQCLHDFETGASLPETCGAALWLTCSAVAEAPDGADAVQTLVSAFFRFLALPSDHIAVTPRVAGWLRTQLVGGCCPVMLDGFDQLLENQDAIFRQRVPGIRQIGSALVLGTRPTEWQLRGEPTGWGAYRPFALLPFSREIGDRYVRGFFTRALDRPDLVDSMQQMLDGNPRLQDTSESPILLFLACLLHAEGEMSGQERRTELYHKISRRIFQGRLRGQQPPAWADGRGAEASAIRFLEGAALTLFEAHPQSHEFSHSEWLAAAEAASKQKLPPPVPAEVLLEDLERVGFLVYTGWKDREPRYTWLHRTFLANLAGAALARPEQAGRWRQAVVLHLWFQPAWEDTLLFLAGNLNNQEMDALLEVLARYPDDIFRSRLCWQWRLAGEAAAIPEKWFARWFTSVYSLMYVPHGRHALLAWGFCVPGKAERHLFQALAAAARLVPGFFEDLALLLDASQEPFLWRRFAIAEAIWKMRLGSDPRLRPALLRGMDCRVEPFAEVRVRLVPAVGKSSHPDVIKRLSWLLDPANEPDREVRALAATTLGKACDESVEALQALLHWFDPQRQPEVETRAAVAFGLFSSTSPHASRALLTALVADPAPLVRLRTAEYLTWSLQNIDDIDEAERVLLRILTTDHESVPQVREVLLTTLRRLDSSRSTEEFMAILEHGDTTDEVGRMRAAAVLGTREHQPAGPLLRRCLNAEESPVVRLEAAMALSKLFDQDAAEDLRRWMSVETWPYARDHMAMALMVLTGNPTDEVLRTLDPEFASTDEMRTAAIKHLLQMAPNSLEGVAHGKAVETLARFLDPAVEPEQGVREAAARALGAAGDTRALPPLFRMLRTAGHRFDPVAGSEAGDALFAAFWKLRNRTPFLIMGHLPHNWKTFWRSVRGTAAYLANWRRYPEQRLRLMFSYPELANTWQFLDFLRVPMLPAWFKPGKWFAKSRKI